MSVIQTILSNISILVCRPDPGATELINALQAMGAQCHKLPGLAIQSLSLSAEDRQCILDLDQYSDVIALSQHAAKPMVDLIDEFWPQPPIQQQWFAIGRATAHVLASEVNSLIAPEADLTSEDLLALPELQEMKGRRVLILKGKQGRDTIDTILTSRGAIVETIEFYERVRPDYPDTKIREALVDFAGDYIVALSGETVKNLKGFADQIGVDISKRHVIVPSERVAHIALQQGFKLTYIPHNLKPIDIIRCIAGIEKERKQKRTH